MASKSKILATASKRSVSNKTFIDDVIDTATNTISDPAFLLSCLLAAAIILTHMDNPVTGPLGNFFLTHRDNHVVKWLMANFSKMCGLLIMLPTSFRAARHLRNIVFIAVAGAIIALPPFPLWYYICVSGALHLYLHVRQASTRTGVILAISLLTYLSWEVLRTHTGKDFSYLLQDVPAAVKNDSPLPVYTTFGNDVAASSSGGNGP